jgi:acyl carrier protein
MGLDDRGFALFDLPSIPEDVLESFHHLEFDKYAGNSRYRRFDQYRLTGTLTGFRIEQLPHRRYVAPREFNSLVGGVGREYAPLTVDFTPFVSWAVGLVPPEPGIDWQVDVHQIRVVATAGRAGVVVPEGPHQDGHEYVVVAVIDRHDVTGGELRLTPLDDPRGEPVLAEVVPAGRAVVLKDLELWHDVTPIEPVGERGWRDTLIMTFTRWAQKKYGEEFEARETADPAVPDADVLRELSMFFETALGKQPDPDEDYFASGELSSLSALELVDFVERSFGIRVEPADLDLDNFRTMLKIARFVRTKKAGARR